MAGKYIAVGVVSPDGTIKEVPGTQTRCGSDFQAEYPDFVGRADYMILYIPLTFPVITDVAAMVTIKLDDITIEEE